MKSRPVLITFSILAGLQVLSGAAALSDVIGPTAFGLFSLSVAAVQVGMTFYVQNATVPVQDVAAYANAQGQVVAGPAAGATNGTPVLVEPGTVLHAEEGVTAVTNQPDGLPARDDLPANPDNYAGEEVAPDYDDEEV